MAKPIALTWNPVPSRCLIRLPPKAAPVHDWLSSPRCPRAILAAGQRPGAPLVGELHVSSPMAAPRAVLWAVRLTASEGSSEVLFRGWVRILSGPDGALTLSVEGRERTPPRQPPALASLLARLIAEGCHGDVRPQAKRFAAGSEPLAG